jgi:hypothetical protein
VGSTLERRPVAALLTFEVLSIPIVTVVYGKALDTMRLLEVSLVLNGDQLWYASWAYDRAFEHGPRFSVPLQDLHERLRAAGKLGD